MNDLDFITDEVLRGMIDRDLKEMNLCFEHGIYKSAVILAGSIIEAILVDYFLAYEQLPKLSKQKIIRASLDKLIYWASNENVNLITEDTKATAHVIRYYRNLIHPGAELRLKIVADKNTAQVAIGLVGIIIKEIKEYFEKKFSYTSKQIINKIIVDPSSDSIYEDIISSMSISEKKKAFQNIPFIDIEKQMKLYSNLEWDTLYEEKVNERFLSFVKFHKELKKSVPEILLKKEVEKIYGHIRNYPRSVSLDFMHFYYEDLDLIEDEKRIVILDYFLDMLETGNEEELIKVRCIDCGFWKYFNNHDDITKLSEAIEKRFNYNNLPDGDNILLSLIKTAIHNYFDIGITDKLVEEVASTCNCPDDRTIDWVSDLISFHNSIRDD